MSVLRIKDSQGNWQPITTIVGETGEAGADGYSPTASVTQTASGYSITITDANGDHTFELVNGEDGQDYVLTAQDKEDIAGLVDVPVDNVQINGTSIVRNGVANIPVGSQDTLGVVKAGTTYGTQTSGGQIRIYKAESSNIKIASGDYKPIVPSTQHEATFYGLAKAAGDVTQMASSNAVGIYTDDAKSAIQTMLGVPSEDDVVTDMQIDGTSIVNDGVVNIPPATASDYGVVKVTSGNDGVFIAQNGTLMVSKPTDAQIKAGTDIRRAITPDLEHKATFYGLAKAAGDNTQVESKNEIGTYTDDAKDAIQQMLGVKGGYVTKDSLDNAGITGRTYTAKFNGEFTVTTAANASYIKPYARASVTGRLYKEDLHRITINGTQYILPTRLWYSITGTTLKVYEYVGNLNLYVSDTSGVPYPIDDVSFVIISDINGSGSIDVLTDTAGTYTILVEKVNITQKQLPASLVYGEHFVPFDKTGTGSTYAGFSVGVNELANKRATFAFGYGNKVSTEFTTVVGSNNKVSSRLSFVEGTDNIVNTSSASFGNHAEGYLNTMSGNCMGTHVEGLMNTASAQFAHAEGASTTASGQGAHTEGFGVVASGESSHAEGTYTIANGKRMHAQGSYNKAAIICPDWVSGTSYAVGDVVYKGDPQYKNYICITANSDSSFDTAKWKLFASNCDTAFVVGNGTADNARSNALKVDWLGNQYLMGDVYVNCDENSENGARLVTEDDVVTDVQINGSSIIQNGVANIPYAGNGVPGLVRAATGYGTALMTSSGHSVIGIYAADDSGVKNGVNNYTPIVPSRQHKAVFYGLAKAAGDTTQSSSSNTVGQYTDSAKTAIKQMLDIKDDYDSLVVEVSGTDPVITGKPSYRYNCGELYTLTVTPPASGTIDIIFTSGTTPTVLSLPNTVKMPDWWAGIETNTTYEMCITDGTYCGVMSWAT